MRVVIQRVKEASVKTEGRLISSIGQGLTVFLGIESADTEEDLTWLCNKIIQLRIFNDDQGIMNLSVQDIKCDLLVISQFTLHASTKKGNRPSYMRAARPEKALPLYENFVQLLEQLIQRPVMKGIFGADMQVTLINDGPVTIIMDSKYRE